jgi:hypothetical protein
VLLSPCIKPGTVTSQPYNHYTLLRSIEDLFGLSHLGYAQLPGGQSLGSDVFNRGCGQAPAARVHAPPLASSVATGPRVAVSWSAAGAQVQSFAVQVQQTSAGGIGWRTLLGATSRHSLTFSGHDGATYQFRVRATSTAGLTSGWSLAQTVMPTGARVSGARYRGRWRLARVRDAWERHALIGSAPGSSLRLSYTGGTLQLVGDVSPQGGRARVTLDGRSRTINLRSARPRARRVLYRAQRPPGRHRLVVQVLGGVVGIEGLAITARRR